MSSYTLWHVDLEIKWLKWIDTVEPRYKEVGYNKTLRLL